MTSIRTTLFALALPIVLADAGPRCGSSNNRPVPPPPPTAPAGDSDAAAPSTPADGSR